MPMKIEQSKTKPSVTALSVAWGFTRAIATEYGHLFSRKELQLSKHLCTVGNGSLSGITWALYSSVLSLPYAVQQTLFNHFVIPAHDQVVMLRKLMIKSKIEEAIKGGVKQIIFLSGGYDIRAIMTALNYPVRVYELDRGPTRECKLRGLNSIPETLGLGKIKGRLSDDGTVIINNNLYLIECDFIKDDLNEKLQAYDFKPDEKKLFIAEGLTAYLDHKQNTKLLDAIYNLMSSADELLISYITADKKSHLFDASLKSAGESHKLCLSLNEIPHFVASKGFAVSKKFDATRLLSSIGDEYDARIYLHEEHSRLKEHYVFLDKRTATVLDINNVPFYEFEIPEKDLRLAVPALK